MKKRLISILLALGTALAVVGLLELHVQARKPSREMAVVEFTDKTKLLGVILQGKYLVVHDADRMAKGESCLYVYSYTEGEALDRVAGEQTRLVTSFHCRPVERTKASDVVLTLVMSRDPAAMFELKEIQLPGSTEGHRVP